MLFLKIGQTKNGFLSQFFVFDLHWGGKSGKKIKLVRNPFQQGGE